MARIDDTPAGEVLGPDDLPDLLRLYAEAYPGNGVRELSKNVGFVTEVGDDLQFASQRLHVRGERIDLTAL